MQDIANIDEVRSFIEDEMSADIARLERRRQMHLKHRYFIMFFGISLILQIPVLAIENPQWRNIIFQLVLMVNVVLSYFAFFRYRNDERFHIDFRRKIYPKLVKLINNEFRYKVSGKIVAKEFVSSGLYYGDILKLKRKDVILGRIKNAVFAISYISAWSSAFNSGDRKQREGDFNFRGLHYVMKVPVNFGGTTIILPTGKTGSHMINRINKNNLNARKSYRNMSVLSTDNDEFNDAFSVFTSSTKGALEFLTPKRIGDIMKIDKLFKNTISLSFFGNLVFLQAHTDKEIFKPDINRTIDTATILNAYLNLLICLRAAGILLD